MPKLRFKGFTEDWDQRKLSDIVNLFGGNAFSSDDSINDGAKWLKIANVGIGHIRWNEKSFLPSSYLEDYPAYRLVPGDYVMALTRPILNGELKIAEITEENILLNQRVAKLIFECDKQFGYQLLRKNTTVNCIDNELAGTDPPNLSVSTMSNIKVRIPSENEQKIIGKYLKRLDNLINIHQRKCDELQKVKKYMLQKMFPKKGEKVPEIRFAGFTGDWEQRKISDMCSISTGKSNTQDKVDDGEYPFYVRSSIIERSTKYLYDEEAVLTVGDGVGTGKVFHYVNGKYDLHQRCYRMYDFTDALNAKYFYHVFSKLFYNRVMSMTAKTSVDSVRMEMIADMKIPTPNIKEQEKVEAVFTNLDNLIALHQRKHETLKEIKKYMLQNMFPEK